MAKRPATGQTEENYGRFIPDNPLSPKPDDIDGNTFSKIFAKTCQNMEKDSQYYSPVTKESLEEILQKVQSCDRQFSQVIISKSIFGDGVLPARHIDNALSAEEISSLTEESCAEESGNSKDEFVQPKIDEKATDEEFALASKLRSCCDALGREKKESISESAKILLKIGELYLDYVDNSTNMEQKQNFIKATALICGAMVRFNMLNATSDLQSAKITLHRVHARLLTAAQATETESDNIFKLSGEIKAKLTKNREEEVADIKRIDVISDFYNLQEESWKIQKVIQLCEKNTKIYIAWMKNIAQKCVSILGNPPCRFAILGLGSLARKEATLYSDFEHTIALEDGVENSKDYNAIKEYFRWYSVLFQIVIIGLGETFIRSVNIKSFCDLYSDDDSKNWFFDEYTPCGIAFDGMAPHSCNVPLGRIEVTKRKKHTIELIQPVTEMVNFLTREEELKNGYFLKDVLSRTCFVYGDETVYNDFVIKSRELIDSENLVDVAKHQLKILLQNPNESVKWSVPDVHVIDKSVKASEYRPITTYIAFASRLCGIHTPSTFETIDEIERKGLIDKQYQHLLKYAVAVTIEGRLKCYMTVGNQRKKINPAQWAGLVGVGSANECLATLRLLRTSVVDMLLKSFKGKEVQWILDLPHRRGGLWNIVRQKILLGLGFSDDVAEMALYTIYSTLESFESSEIDGKIARLVLTTFFPLLQEAYLGMLHNQIQRFSKLGLSKENSDPVLFLGYILRWCEWVNLKIIEMKHRGFQVFLTAHQVLCMVYFYQGRYDEGIQKFEEWNQMYRTGKDKIIHPIKTFVDMWQHDVDMRARTMTTDDFVQYIENALVDEIELERRYVLQISLGRVLLEMGDKSKLTKLFLLGLLYEIKKNARQLGMLTYQTLLVRLEHLLQKHNLVLETHEASRQSIEVVANGPDRWVKSTLSPEIGGTKLSIQKTVISCKPGGQPIKITTAVRTNPGKLRYIIQQIRTIFVAFSYEEMMDLIRDTIEDCKYCLMDEKLAKEYALPYAVSLMALFENVRKKQYTYATRAYRYAPKVAKYMRVMQPFFYAFFDDVAPTEDIENDLHTHAEIVKAIFGCRENGREWNPYEVALSHFTSLRFQTSLRILWRIMHFSQRYPLLMSRTTELFLTGVVTVLVLQKRKSPAPCFTKTREVSRKQFLWTWPGTKKYGAFMKSNEFECSLYLYHDDPLVPVFNLAVECFGIALPRCAILLWMILGAPSLTNRMKQKAIRVLLFATKHRFLSTNTGRPPSQTKV